MTSVIIGLFPTQKDAKNLAADLENSGFQNEDYIVYLNKEEEEDKNTFWNTLFGSRKPQFNTNEMDKLIASVAIKNEQELAAAIKIFNNHHVIHTYEFTDITIKDAQSLSYLKTKVALQAKSEVYSSQLQNRNSAQNLHSGIAGDLAFDIY